MSQTRFDRFYRITNQMILDAYRKESRDINDMLHAMKSLGDKVNAQGVVTHRMRRVSAENFKVLDWPDRPDAEAWTKPDGQGYSTLKVSRKGSWSDEAKATHKLVKDGLKAIEKGHQPVWEGMWLTMLDVDTNQIQLGGRTSVIGIDGAIYLAIKFQVAPENMAGVEELTPAQFEKALNDNEEDMKNAS